MKTVIAVIAGYLVWTAIWLLGNAGLASGGLVRKDPTLPIESSTSLLLMLALSVLASLAAGRAAAAIDRFTPHRAAWFLSLALLATGIGVQWSVRELMPVWYHAVFLLLLVPVTLAGARLVRSEKPLPADSTVQSRR